MKKLSLVSLLIGAVLGVSAAHAEMATKAEATATPVKPEASVKLATRLQSGTPIQIINTTKRTYPNMVIVVGKSTPPNFQTITSDLISSNRAFLMTSGNFLHQKIYVSPSEKGAGPSCSTMDNKNFEDGLYPDTATPTVMITSSTTCTIISPFQGMPVEK